MTDWELHIDHAIEAATPRLLEMRRHLHRYPEPSGEEFETTAFLRDAVAELGPPSRSPESGRGLIVDAATHRDGPLIGLRGDIDALRIYDLKDEAAAPYRSSREGVMHACGHDGHSTVAYGALVALAALEQADAFPWPLRYRGILQPAEESALGALEMMAAGALEGGMCGLYSLHLDPSRPVGRIGIRYGALTAACDDVTIRILGRGGHAARPHQSCDPIAAAAQLVQMLYAMVPRGLDSHDPVVLTIGQIVAGHSPNVIPESAELLGTLRTLDSEIRTRAKQQMQQVCDGLAQATGARVTLEFGEGPPSVNNSRDAADVLSIAAMGVVGAHGVDLIERPSMGGEDFAFYLQHVPGAMFRLGSARRPDGDPPLHSPHFDIDERALGIGARVLARAVVLAADPQRISPQF